MSFLILKWYFQVQSDGFNLKLMFPSLEIIFYFQVTNLSNECFQLDHFKFWHSDRLTDYYENEKQESQNSNDNNEPIFENRLARVSRFTKITTSSPPCTRITWTFMLSIVWLRTETIYSTCFFDVFGLFDIQNWLNSNLKLARFKTSRFQNWHDSKLPRF